VMAKIWSQSWPRSSSSTWMWNMSSMASNSFESNPPDGHKGMEQSNYQTVPWPQSSN
jgi:hypothetical protein